MGNVHAFSEHSLLYLSTMRRLGIQAYCLNGKNAAKDPIVQVVRHIARSGKLLWGKLPAGPVADVKAEVEEAIVGKSNRKVQEKPWQNPAPGPNSGRWNVVRGHGINHESQDEPDQVGRVEEVLQGNNLPNRVLQAQLLNLTCATCRLRGIHPGFHAPKDLAAWDRHDDETHREQDDYG